MAEIRFLREELRRMICQEKPLVLRSWKVGVGFETTKLVEVSFVVVEKSVSWRWRARIWRTATASVL